MHRGAPSTNPNALTIRQGCFLPMATRLICYGLARRRWEQAQEPDGFEDGKW
jgi:hypothetical protein